MTEERRLAERRRLVRRKPEAAPPESGALVPVAAAKTEPAEGRKAKRGDAAFTAQVLGQGGQKRGLRGGAETLGKARSTYLGTEWSGPADRRPHPGTITKTEI
jgi:hypothetical protein